MTGAYKLPSEAIVHVIAPTYACGVFNGYKKLRKCYTKSLNEAINIKMCPWSKSDEIDRSYYKDYIYLSANDGYARDDDDLLNPKSIAVPLIGDGTRLFPKEKATVTAEKVIKDWIEETKTEVKIYLVL